MDTRRCCVWLALAASAGACERCTWRLDEVELTGATGDTTDGSTTSGGPVAEDTGETGHGELATAGATTDGLNDIMSPGGASTGSGGETSSGSSGSGADDVGVPPPSYCGNGDVDRGEKCDDGNFEDDDGCPSDQGGCKLATCGDGFVWVGEEDCEDLDRDDLDDCSNDCWAPRIVFVTSAIHSGNLGGVDGADAICGAAAKSEKLPGQFKAWLSSQEPQTAPVDRFMSGKFKGWYVFRKTGQLARGWDALLAGDWMVPLSWTDEAGNPLSPFPSNYAWSNVTSEGTALPGPDCSSWHNSGLGEGSVGRVPLFGPVSDDWTDYEERPCESKAHLYCFQVGPSLP